MIKAVLLDLDNTLLSNPDNVFAVEYLRLVEDYFADLWQFQGMASLVLKSLRAMNDSRDMQQTNAEIALNIISQSTEHSHNEVQLAFSGFYEGVYPTLKNCVEPVPDANKLVSFLRSQGYALVIATNPIYPPEAIRQRLAWAGLPDDFAAYWLVTHAENMHFTKPNLAYYAEILARTGMEPDESIMVGDNIDNDIVPAATVGLHTFQIVREDATHNTGRLTDFFRQVTTKEWADGFGSLRLSSSMIEPQLRGNVGALFGMLAEVKNHFWTQHPDPNEWSILQIVCHLWDSEMNVQRPRLQHILQEDNPFLVAPKAPPGPDSQPCDSDGYGVARRFAEERTTTMAFLRTLSPSEWHRPARHSVFGPTSLLEMALFTAQHDRLHLNQLCQTMGNCE